MLPALGSDHSVGTGTGRGQVQPAGLSGLRSPHKGAPVCPIKAIIKNQLASCGEQTDPARAVRRGRVAADSPCPLQLGRAGVSSPLLPPVYWVPGASFTPC